MNTIYDVEHNLTALLEQDKELCNLDDMELYLAYVKATDPAITQLRFDTVIKNRAVYGLPSLETVGRARRKISEKRPDLRACKRTRRAREKVTEEMKEYAKS